MITDFLIDTLGCPRHISFVAIGAGIVGPFIPILLVVIIERIVRQIKRRSFRFPRAFGSILFFLWGIFSCYWFVSFFSWIGDCGGF